MKIGIIGFLAISATSVLAQDTTMITNASYTQVGTVTFSERHFANKTEYVHIISQAEGFSTEQCDFITPFSAIEPYEAQEAHPDKFKKLEVTMDGRTYQAALHSHGYYPLGLDLACLDLIPDASGPASVLRMRVENILPGSILYTDGHLNKLVLGSPIVNKKTNEVVGLYIDPDTIVWGHDIQRFLKLVVGDTPKSWPEPRKR